MEYKTKYKYRNYSTFNGQDLIMVQSDKLLFFKGPYHVHPGHTRQLH